MGDYPGNRLAVSLYGLVMLLMALGFVLMRRRMIAVPGLLREQADRGAFLKGTGYSVLMGPVAYLVGAGLAWVSVAGPFACYAAIAIYFVFPHSTRSFACRAVNLPCPAELPPVLFRAVPARSVARAASRKEHPT